MVISAVGTETGSDTGDNATMSDEMARPAVFDPTVLARLLAHLNRCHTQENLVLARLANERMLRDGEPGADADGHGDPDGGNPVVRAWIAGLDGHGVDLLGETASEPVVLRLTFGWPARTLAAVGDELRYLYRTACRAPR